MTDIVIVGGGVIGATCALMLANSGVKVTLIEYLNKSDLISPKLDRRNIALSYGSILLFKELNIWGKLIEYSSAIKNIIVSQKGSFTKTFLDAESYNIPAFGFTVSLQMIKKILWGSVIQNKNINIKFQTQVTDIKDNNIIIRNNISSTEEKIDYKLCIASDGNNSLIKRISKIKSDKFDYQQTAIISTLFHEKPHNNFAFERFVKDGALAILPLNDYLNSEYNLKNNISSLVWIVKDSQAEKLYSLEDKNFIKKLQENFGYRLGRILDIKNRQKFDLTASISMELYNLDNKVVFLGNAANELHPVMAQGLNLGLRDVYTFVKKVNKYLKLHNNLDNLDFLSEYAIARKKDHNNIISTTHFLANNKIPFFPKNLGILFFNELESIQSNIVKKALGFELYANA